MRHMKKKQPINFHLIFIALRYVLINAILLYLASLEILPGNFNLIPAVLFFGYVGMGGYITLDRMGESAFKARVKFIKESGDYEKAPCVVTGKGNVTSSTMVNGTSLSSTKWYIALLTDDNEKVEVCVLFDYYESFVKGQRRILSFVRNEESLKFGNVKTTYEFVDFEVIRENS